MQEVKRHIDVYYIFNANDTYPHAKKMHIDQTKIALDLNVDNVFPLNNKLYQVRIVFKTPTQISYFVQEYSKRIRISSK